MYIHSNLQLGWPYIIKVSVNFVIISSVSLTFAFVFYIFFAPWIKKFRNVFWTVWSLFSVFFYSFNASKVYFNARLHSVWTILKGNVMKHIAVLTSTFTSVRRSRKTNCMNMYQRGCRICTKQPLHQNGSLNDFIFWRSYEYIDPKIFIRHFTNKRRNRIKNNLAHIFYFIL